MKKCFLLATVCLALGASQGQKPTKDALRVYLEGTVETTMNWESKSTKGVNAALREVSRERTGGKLAVTYRVFTTGLPRDQIYGLLSWQADAVEPQILATGVSVSADGYAVCEGKKPGQCKCKCEDGKTSEVINLDFSPKKAEIIQLALVSKNGKHAGFAAIVPDPIMTTDHGCDLEVIRLRPNFEIALVRGKGFKANEDLTFTSKSLDEVLTQKAAANSHGVFVTALLPFAKDKDQKDKDHGQDEVSVKGTTCSPALSFQWGVE